MEQNASSPISRGDPMLDLVGKGLRVGEYTWIEPFCGQRTKLGEVLDPVSGKDWFLVWMGGDLEGSQGDLRDAAKS